ncbi:capsule assembly Wzi family protein [Mucilaginibacter sp. NFX135]|uniref:capsule assembly Wzi family protein n=1 Tax=Mucilaginibacter sp. NFX135 TaxID=3402687 RepID=UPI003AFB769A
MKKILLLPIALLCLSIKTFSQTIPVGSYTEDVARRNQLLGKSDNTSSFTVRPVNGDWTDTDSSFKQLVASKPYASFQFMGKPSGIQILPFNWLNDYNVKRPYGYNNSSLYPAAGYQTRVSGGFLLKASIFRVQIKPEFVYAQNKSFNTFADIQSNSTNIQLLRAYYTNINGIDAPERFGNKSLQHLYPGQSKITVNFKNMEAGVSTENMWWGPSVQNSIMMSNSAPGFLHWTFNSVKPIKTIIGSFEWQIIGGNLKQSGYLPIDTNRIVNGKGLFKPKPEITRYISAYTVNWQPKWLKGLYLGVTGYDYLDKDSLYHNKNIFRKLFPVITGSSIKANDASNSTGGDRQDFAFALNVRQLLPLYNAELYFEWARNDRTGSINDFLQEPGHSVAITLGGRKLFELSKDRYIQIKAELTQLQWSPTFLLRDEPTWYTHIISPRDGYTNEGRYIGAGIGPGGNSFMFDISYLKGMNSYGLTLERQLHNNDLYYSAFSGTGNFNSHWVDINSTFYTNIKLKKYLISGELTPVYSLNYQYNHGNSFNLHARLNLTYYFE